MQRNVHLLTSRTSTGRPAANEGTGMQQENEPSPAEPESSTSGTPADEQSVGEQIDSGAFLGWMAQAVNTTMQGMADRLSLEQKQRVAAVHMAKLIMGDGATCGEYLAVASFILGEDET